MLIIEDRRIAVPWTCARCKRAGRAPKVWQRTDEDATATATRFERETRQSCVHDCLFSVTTDPIVREKK